MMAFSPCSHNLSNHGKVSNGRRTSDLLQRLSTGIVSYCLWQGEILVQLTCVVTWKSPQGGEKGGGAKTQVSSGLLVGQIEEILWEGDLKMPSGASAFYVFFFNLLLTVLPQGLLCKQAGRSE